MFGKKKAEIQDHVSAAINNGELPTLDDIVTDIGKEGVVPVYFALATNFQADPRRSGHPAASHHINAMLRPKLWNLGYTNTPASLIHLSFHDLGEDYGETIAGALAINRWIGTVFGGDYDFAADMLTDWRTFILKYLREEGPKLNGARPEEITHGDIVEYANLLKPTMIADPRERQKKALAGLEGRINKFEEWAMVQKVSDETKDAVRGVVGTSLKGLKKCMSKLIPDDQVTAEAVKRIDLVERMISSPFPEDGEVALFDKGRSPVFHAARKRAYELYLGRFSYHVLRAEHWPKSFAPFEIYLAKLGDASDNIRIISSIDLVTRALQYAKARIVIKETGKCLEEAGKHVHPFFPEMKMALDFMKRQLMYRIVADNAQGGYESDTNFDQYRQWLKSQFVETAGIFGKDFMKQFGDDLRNAPHRIGLQEKTAENILPVYKDLSKLPREGKGGLLSNLAFFSL